MTSGGPRRNSGRAPDPAALRRDRKDDAAWVTLPAEGYAGDVPVFPLERVPVYDVFYEDKKRVKVFDPDATVALHEQELELWGVLWAKPQAFMWAKLGLDHEVAAYVRAFIRSVSADGNASDRTAALRMAAEIGLSLPGMHSLRWKFSEDELAARRDEAVATGPVGARDRLKVIGGS